MIQCRKSNKIAGSLLTATRTILLCLFVSLSAWANSGQQTWSVHGEALYFSPSFDGTYYTIVGSVDDGAGHPTPSGKRKNNPVGFAPGFHVEGKYALYNSCIDFRLKWTHVFACSRESTQDNRSAPQLWPVAAIPNLPNVSEPFSGTASSRIGVMYQKAECLFDERIWKFGLGRLCLREGIEWIYLRYHEVINYAETLGPQEQIVFHAHTKGLGPQLGVITIFEPGHLFCWHPRHLSYTFTATGSLIPVNSKCKMFSFNAIGIESSVTQQSLWRIVPELVIRFSIDHSCSFSRVRASIGCGYEIATYINGTSKLLFTDSQSPGLSTNQYSDFYVHGFFLGLGLHF